MAESGSAQRRRPGSAYFSNLSSEPMQMPKVIILAFFGGPTRKSSNRLTRDPRFAPAPADRGAMTPVHGEKPPMDRPSASIVIPVWNQWEATKACLDSLRPTLGLRDEVIVVDNGSQDATGAALRAYPWLRIITNEQNRGFAVACNQGAAAATREIIVLLNNDTVLTRHWIEPLVAPFADSTVGATGPRSNFV